MDGRLVNLKKAYLTYLEVISNVVPKIWARTNSAMVNVWLLGEKVEGKSESER